MAKRKAARKQARSVCILGYAEETRDMVFHLPETVEIWGINMAHAFTHTSDSAGSITSKTKAVPTNWFQIHPRDWATPKGEMTGYFGRPKEHLDFLASFSGTVWLQKEDPDIPNGKRYPFEEIVAAAGRDYCTSSFAYQAALLWYQHTVEKNPVERVYVYGVNLSSIDEYIHQRPCVEYWVGRLEEAGVKVTIPDGSAICKGPRYGMDTGGDLQDHAFDRLQHWKSKYMESWANTNTAMSMQTETKYWAAKLSRIAEQFPDVFVGDVQVAIQDALSARTHALQNMVDRSGADLNGAMGMVKDNQHWLALTGGIDHRAPQLPELRIPSKVLETDFEPPSAKSI